MLQNTTLEMVKMNSNPTKTTKAVRERSPSNILLVSKKNQGSGEGQRTTPTPSSLEGLPNDIKMMIL
jgi:hypothetical protein